MSGTNNGAAKESRIVCSVVKIKEEKIDVEIEEKINSTQLIGCAERVPQISTNGSIVCKQEYSESRSSVDTGGGNDSNEQSVELDEKKSIQPIKSSNEILAELFSVFNATPPEELLDDKNLLKKGKHKKHKKDKKKRKKKSKVEDRVKPENKESDGSDSSVSSSEGKGDGDRSKHKKHKRHKHKVDRTLDKRRKNEKQIGSKNKPKDRYKCKEKDEERRPSKERTNQPYSRITADISPKANKRCGDEYPHESITSKNSRITENGKLESSRDIPKHNSFYNGFHESNHYFGSSSSCYRSSSHVRIKNESNDRAKSGEYKTEIKDDCSQISEVSLSDEENYVNDYNVNTHSRSFGNSSYSIPSRGDHRHKPNKSYYKGAEKKHSRERDRDTYIHRHRGRSPSRSRSRDLGIDKKRLLEIARKNAISMFKRGNLPGCSEMTEEIKDKVLLKMRYGGRTVQDLTDFCKKLSNGENLNDISDLSSEEDSDVDKSGNPKAFNHPFVIKEREPIVMDIRGTVSKIPNKSQENQTKAITMQFPVSSGQQHRLTEAWVPVVEHKEALTPLPSLPSVTQSTSIFRAVPVKNVFEKSVPVQTEQEPAFKAVDNNPTPNLMDESGTDLPIAKVNLNSVLSNDQLVSTSTIASIPPPIVAQPVVVPPPAPFVPDVPVPSAVPSLSVFPQVPMNKLDVSTIISKRLNAMRRLQDNPMDTEALKMMYHSQKEMSSWANSKHMPGQFTGSTGVNTLSIRELNSGPQAWARRDQLTSTLPMTGGMGMQLLKKMGWKPGEGLGREKSGSLQPLLLDVKLDKRGLVSEEDNGYQSKQGPAAKKRRNAVHVLQVQQDMQDKHPVSLLNELTSKRKWTPPLYTLVNEGGPSHNKMFLFSVSINGQTFTPAEGSNTKKDAKVKAARVCLQQIGIIP